MAKYIMLLGAPNSGKGTVCQVIAEKFDIYHLSTGDLLRDHIVVGTNLGLKAKVFMDAGELVPDDLVLEMVNDKIENDISCSEGVVFDGFPRTIYQAEQFEKTHEIDAVIYLNISDETVIQRALRRRVCPNCKKSFSISSEKETAVCNRCGSKLIAREDSKREVIEKRLVAYKESTLPLVEFYKNKLVEVDGEQSPEEVAKDVIEKLNGLFKK